MSFFRVVPTTIKEGVIEIRPEFIVGRSDDLMIRNGKFYAIWNEATGLWSKDEYDVVDIVDKALWDYKEKFFKASDNIIRIATMASYSSRSWSTFENYAKVSPDNFKELDRTLTFASTKTVKDDYASIRLPYDMPESGTPCPAWDELISTLYDPLERRKIEWAIGAIVSGDSKTIQKFLVFYGDPGTGKSTILNIIEKIFHGYCGVFEGGALTNARDQFSLETLQANPLVGIEHDGDLSKASTNSRMNAIVAHETLVFNGKNKSRYEISFDTFLLMATNKAVKISDAKSGILRRLIDVNPTGNTIRSDIYRELMERIDFEIGAIARRCLDIYTRCGKDYYEHYRSSNMLYKTDVFYNFVDDAYFTFATADGITLKQAYALYKNYCNETSLQYSMPMYSFREELKNYFRNFEDRVTIDGNTYRSYYTGFKTEKFDIATDMGTKADEDESVSDEVIDTEDTNVFTLESMTSVFDTMCASQPAQYATADGRPLRKWENVTTKLSDLDTTKTHYVLLPANHIVIDFDIKDENGEKSPDLNLKAASNFPPTYAEFSKSGGGLHLHYIYDGDASQLSRIYADHIEVKVFGGNASLRRRLSLCNDLPIAHISGGLPLKENKVVSKKQLSSEKSLRDLILRNLRKEIHPATKPSIDFIYKILDDAYNSGMSYDVTDMSSDVLAFAVNSTNQAPYCIQVVSQMRFKSDDREDGISSQSAKASNTDGPLVFYDIEVFPNLLLINYKAEGEDSPMHRLVNPSSSEIEPLFDMKLVGYNNRRYDNHIIYGRWLGKSTKELYQQSQLIINGTREQKMEAMYPEAYNISYTDVYDFASAAHKMSLKKAEVEMGIHHLELGLDWDKPVPESEWERVSEYCDNDVLATEARFVNLKADWVARQILAVLADKTVNDTTNALTTQFIFKTNPNPQSEFCYRNLAKPISEAELRPGVMKFLKEIRPDMVAEPFVSPIETDPSVSSVLPYFPGYKFEWVKKTVAGKEVNVARSTYRDEEIGEGGYVYAEPGMYTNVALLDITSMHPYSSLDECIFGPRYTRVLFELIHARVEIKHENWDVVRTLLGGALSPYVDMVLAGEITAEELSLALKTAINSIYGLTSAKFPNKFKDPRNVDNIVAKRGELFMIDLKHAVQEQGYTVAHIKTDSIKIPNATPSIIQFVMDFGKKYGYAFEHEATYDRMCLVNKAVYIARYKTGKHAGEWTATGAQFRQPYVFKFLFSKEPITFDDMCEVRNVKSALYLDMNEGLPPHPYTKEDYDSDVERMTNGLAKKAMKPGLDYEKLCAETKESILNDPKIKLPEIGEMVDTHQYSFIGRAGQFTPILDGHGGGVLMRDQDGKMVSAPDSDGYRWLESEMVRKMGLTDCVNLDFYREKVDEAVSEISQYCDFDWFVSNDEPDRIKVP